MTSRLQKRDIGQMITIKEYLLSKSKQTIDEIETMLASMEDCKAAALLSTIVDTIRLYRDSSEAAKNAIKYVCGLLIDRFELIWENPGTKYLTLDKTSHEYSESTRIVKFTAYYPSDWTKSMNLAIDIFDLPSFTQFELILSMSENECFLYELNGKDFKQFKKFVEERCLDFELPIHGHLTKECINDVIKYIEEKLS